MYGESHLSAKKYTHLLAFLCVLTRLLIESQEIKPKVQPCLMTKHDKVDGLTFNMVKGRKYMTLINLFREGGGNLSNPVKAVHALTVHTEDGTPLQLFPKSVKKKKNKALPNCVSVSTPFDPADCQSKLLLTPTQWPDVRATTFEILLELNSVQGREVSLVPTVHFQVNIFLSSLAELFFLTIFV
jgi:hypothetical protein